MDTHWLLLIAAKRRVHAQIARLALALAGAVCLAGCGYTMGQYGALKSYGTISVPYVVGDGDGSLTAAIIHEIATLGCLEYRSSEGALTLAVKVINSNDVNIGFRYDRHKDGKLQHTLIPVETRLTLTVEVTAIEAASEAVLLGPVLLIASVELDHDYNADRNPTDGRANTFSLGQLTNADVAFQAAAKPLNSAIARKIAEYLIHSW